MKKPFFFVFTIIMLFISTIVYSQNNITITDNSSHNADVSSVLDVYSTSKGMLVPRMNTTQINIISSPATGLLVFNTDDNSFWFYNGNTWDDLSSGSSGLWEINPSSGAVYLKNTQTNVGIGTIDPVGKLSIVGNSGSNPDNPLFEVKDEFGYPIFSVTSEGVRIFVKNVTKGATGGFAVGKYGIAKDIPDTTFLLVTPDSTRVYTSPYGKGVTGGFAVGKYGIAKGSTNNYMQMTDDNYFIGHRAGDSITDGLFNTFFGYESGINTTIGSHNVFMGYQSGYENSAGGENIFIGYQAGYNYTGQYGGICIGHRAGSEAPVPNGTFIGRYAAEHAQGASNGVFIGANTGQYATGGNNAYIGTGTGSGTSGAHNLGAWNVFLGNNVGTRNTTGDYNLFAGWRSGDYNTTGDYNVFLGHYTGRNNTQGARNTFVGTWSGYDNTLGTDNVFVGYSAGYNETGSNLLYIENSDATTPLIFGDFSTDLVGINDVVPSANLHVKQVGATEEGFAIENNEDTDTWSWEIGSNDMNLYFNGTFVGSWDDATGNYTGISDQNLKKDIEIIDKSVLNELMNLKPVTYRLLHADENSTKAIGFIAQDVQKYFPEMIYQREDGFLSLHYPDFGVIAIKAIQEQQVIIDSQFKMISDLKTELNTLNKKMNEMIKLLNNQ